MRSNSKLFFLIPLFLLACVNTAWCLPQTPVTIHHEFIPHPNDPSKKIEFYWAQPEGKGPWPVKVFIHGHQEPDRPGGKAYVDWGVIEETTKHDEVAVAVSQPGYGASSGPADYCGPFTQKAVIAVIDLFRKKDFVLPEKIGLEGTSRGAVVASMVVTQDQRIAAAVLISGSYDTTDTFNRLTALGKTQIIAKEIAKNIQNESGGSKQALLDRSAIPNAKKIKTPLLILQGAKDDRTFPDQAEKFAKLVNENGTPAKVVIYPNAGHSIPVSLRSDEVHPFFKRYLKGN